MEICGFLPLFTPIVKHVDMSRTDSPSGGEAYRRAAPAPKAAACIAGQGIMRHGVQLGGTEGSIEFFKWQ